MDQCCGLTGSVRSEEIFSVENCGDMPIATTIKLLQSLFIYEGAFLEGASIMESINQCIYMWETTWPSLETKPGIGDRAALLYCKSLAMSLRHQFKTVLAADIYEGILLLKVNLIFIL